MLISITFGLIFFFLALWFTRRMNKWDKIERINIDYGITRKTCYIDFRGYLRWKDNRKLCHRDIAQKYIGKPEGLSAKDLHVHHINKNKLDNRKENLTYLSPEEHWKTHNYLKYKGKTYRKIAKLYHQKQTNNAILIRNTWVPKSLIRVKKGDIFVEIWFYRNYF